MNEILDQVTGVDTLDQIKIRQEVKIQLDRNDWSSVKPLDWEEGMLQEPLCSNDYQPYIRWDRRKDYFIDAYD